MGLDYPGSALEFYHKGKKKVLATKDTKSTKNCPPAEAFLLFLCNLCSLWPFFLFFNNPRPVHFLNGRHQGLRHHGHHGYPGPGLAMNGSARSRSQSGSPGLFLDCRKSSRHAILRAAFGLDEELGSTPNLRSALPTLLEGSGSLWGHELNFASPAKVHLPNLEPVKNVKLQIISNVNKPPSFLNLLGKLGECSLFIFEMKLDG